MSNENGSEARPGFQVGGRFYPSPTSFRLGDPVLVTELTGLSWQDFLEKLDAADDDDEGADPAVMLGIVGVAIWQQHPGWRRDKAVAHVQSLSFESISAVGMEDAEGDAGPPDEPGEPSSTDSPPALNGSPGLTLPTPTPLISGRPASTTGVPV